eukprot:TRINITY_DN2615_c0_g4_i1.p1 TRINITY_DN2615_c0_g4~~TRINITY_DN2615_c0_g4_i1.p1  ORF type:complete len:112 (-),score=31.35 TRINITY_DN2615_c0_g4_i1:201-536(-)
MASRPLTPFMLFCKQERDKKASITVKELAGLWHALSKHSKEKFLNAYRTEKKKYEKCLEEAYGNEPLTYQSKGRIKELSLINIRGILGSKPDIKPLAKEAYPVLLQFLVWP